MIWSQYLAGSSNRQDLAISVSRMTGMQQLLGLPETAIRAVGAPVIGAPSPTITSTGYIQPPGASGACLVGASDDSRSMLSPPSSLDSGVRQSWNRLSGILPSTLHLLPHASPSKECTPLVFIREQDHGFGCTAPPSSFCASLAASAQDT